MAPLAEVCDPSTKVVIIGHHNDIGLYRELMRNGISEYLVCPIGMAEVISASSPSIFVDPDAEPLGRTIAFIGAKGGVGSSTIAHNCAFGISTLFSTETILADLDLPMARPISISIRTRRRALPKRSLRRTVWMRCSSTVC